MSVRIRRSSKAPLAYVPVEPNKIVVVPTTNLPQPHSPTSPANLDHLQRQAEQIASPNSASSSTPPGSRFALRSTGSTPKRRRNTIATPDSRPPDICAPPERPHALSEYQGSEESLVHGNHTTSPRPRQGSWFHEAVIRRGSMNTPGPSSVRGKDPNRLDEPRRPLGEARPSSIGSAPSIEVIIPQEARSIVASSLQRRPGSPTAPGASSLEEQILHHNDVVEHLEVIDAHIATVSHLSNAANTILIPPLSFYSRKPVIDIPTVTLEQKPDGKDVLDLHVEDVLSKRAKLRRSLSGLWAYLKTPVGILTAIYGFLVAFWGAAIVLFLGKLINLHNDYLQGYWVEVSSQVVNGLFTIQGVGFLPWRVMDTYHILWIVHFKRLTVRTRDKAGLPPAGDDNDIPDPNYDPRHMQILTDKQMDKLRYHQRKFQHNQTWYRPHATDTHKAFSINMALWICLFVDLNSVFQIMLCGVMWGMDRFTRPAWTIGSLIPLSFSAGIIAGVLIWRGGEQSKKTEEVEKRLREAFEQEKKVLEERYGDEDDAEEEVMVPQLQPPNGKHTSDPEKNTGATEHHEKQHHVPEPHGDLRSPLAHAVQIDDTMTIQEEPNGEPSKESKSRRSSMNENENKGGNVNVNVLGGEISASPIDEDPPTLARGYNPNAANKV